MRYLNEIARAGDDVQPDAIMVALRSCTDAEVQLGVNEDAAAVGGPVADAHLALVRADIAALEAHIRATHDAELADVRTRCALLQAYSAAGDEPARARPLGLPPAPVAAAAHGGAGLVPRAQQPARRAPVWSRG